MRYPITATLIVLTCAGRAWADSRSSQRAAIVGLRPVTIEIQDIEGDAAANVDLAQLRALGEAKLRELGVPLANRGEDPRAPFLSVTYDLRVSTHVGWGCGGWMQLHVNWLLSIPRSPDGVRMSKFLIDGRPVNGPCAALQPELERSLRDALAVFAEDYFVANPRPQGR
jgi:hypothetical protein